MFLITRCTGESFVIGDDITITVVEARNSRVRLSVKAPKDIPIHRAEVYDRIAQCRSAPGPESPIPKGARTCEEGSGD